MLFLFVLCIGHKSVALESVALESLEENNTLEEDRPHAARKDGRPRTMQVKDPCKGERIVALQEKKP